MLCYRCKQEVGENYYFVVLHEDNKITLPITEEDLHICCYSCMDAMKKNIKITTLIENSDRPLWP